MSEQLQYPSEKSFDQLSEIEQVERFKKLSDFIKQDGDFGELWENMYKYTDKMNIPGETPESTKKVVRDINGLIKVVRESMAFFALTSSGINFETWTFD